MRLPFRTIESKTLHVSNVSKPRGPLSSQANPGVWALLPKGGALTSIKGVDWKWHQIRILSRSPPKRVHWIFYCSSFFVFCVFFCFFLRWGLLKTYIPWFRVTYHHFDQAWGFGINCHPNNLRSSKSVPHWLNIWLMPTMYKPKNIMIWESFFSTKRGWFRADLPDGMKQARTLFAQIT